MKKAFTLIEMLIVIVVLSILMAIIFRLSNISTESEARAKTIYRLQCIENCLSGYYAAFGSYPPVKRHGLPDPTLEVNQFGIQRESHYDIFAGNNIRSEKAKQQIEAACKSQPFGCSFPFPRGFSEEIKMISQTMQEMIAEGSNNDSWFDSSKEGQLLKAKFEAGFDDGGSGGNTGRFSKNKGKSDWRNIQLFRYGVMSYLLPRYLIMMQGCDDFYGGQFAQWSDNNVLPCDPFTGNRFSSWNEVKDKAEGNNKSDIARIANIPSQAVCARWMPNLSGICKGSSLFRLFGVNIIEGSDDDSIALTFGADVGQLKDLLHSPHGIESTSVEDLYILDSVTIFDGWENEFYYYSPVPHQSYTLWSAGANKRTFPPWISRDKLPSIASEYISTWISDDIVKLSN